MLVKASMKATLLLAFVGTLSACGSGTQWVQDANVRVYTQDGDRFGELSAVVKSGQTTLPASDFPVYDPRNSAEVVGHLTLKNSLSGDSSEIVLAMDINKLLGVSSGVNDPYLPNGSLIPIRGLNPATLQTYQSGNGSIKVYTNVDSATKTAMLGLAVGIKNMKVDVAANVFYPFKTAAVTGLAGLYTGQDTWQSGFALFADASAIFGETVSAAQNVLAQKAVTPRRMHFIQQEPAQQDMQKIQNMLYKLDQNKTHLIIR